MSQYQLSGGTVRGSAHAYHMNNQDGFTYGEVVVDGETLRWGFVLDGCSSAKRAELGVQETLSYINRVMPHFLQDMKDASHEVLSAFAQEFVMKTLVRHIEFMTATAVLGSTALAQFIKKPIPFEQHPQRDELNAFIREAYLFTVLGFVQTDKYTVVFARGDGVININGVVFDLNENNAPIYPAYFAIPWTVPSELLESCEFHLVPIETKYLNFVILGTDSWSSHRLLFRYLPTLFKPNSDRWIQRRLNIWSEDDSDFTLPQEEEYQNEVASAFSDDTTAVALTRIKK